MSVTQLATNERRYSDPISSNTADHLFGTGTLTIQQGSDISISRLMVKITLTTLITTSTRQMAASEPAFFLMGPITVWPADKREDWGRE